MLSFAGAEETHAVLRDRQEGEALSNVSMLRTEGSR